MVCASVRSIIPSLKLGDYLCVQARKPCSISHIFTSIDIEGTETLIIKLPFRSLRCYSHGIANNVLVRRN